MAIAAAAAARRGVGLSMVTVGAVVFERLPVVGVAAVMSAAGLQLAKGLWFAQGVMAAVSLASAGAPQPFRPSPSCVLPALLVAGLLSVQRCATISSGDGIAGAVWGAPRAACALLRGSLASRAYWLWCRWL
jgi:hypothetical protein